MIDYREDNKWTVYIHIVPKELSGYDYDKYYVGITKQKVEKRWGYSSGIHYKKSTRFYEAIKECILRDKEMKTLDNKIKCLFSSKRFYPGTLKNEFPEAYEVYVKLFEGENVKQEPKSKSSTCDSIESIRATLLSNK